MSKKQDSPTSACKEPLLSLHELATLPLHRVGITGGINQEGQMFAVGGVSAKSKAARATPGIRAFAVSEGQTYETDDGVVKPVGEHIEGLRVIRSPTLGGLLKGILDTVGDEVYGPVLPLPEVLNRADTEAHSYDYRASNFHAFNWLDSLVCKALFDSPEASGTQKEPADGKEVVKRWNRGYIHVLGSAGCGKSSWALNWMRQSQGQVVADCADINKLPPLAGWYFARRYGATGSTSQPQHQDEILALQNLISLARRQHDVPPPDKELLTLLSPDEARAYRGAFKFGQTETDEERNLRERFTEALNHLSDNAKPTALTPLVFLIDGADEMWSQGSQRYHRSAFPKILPSLDNLPEHVYIVLMSRPGDHMTGYEGRWPLLRYQFNKLDVAESIKSYLRKQADDLDHRLPGNESSPILRSDQLQDNVCTACAGAFGYAPLLLWQWIADENLQGRIEHFTKQLLEWQSNPKSLPYGVYGLRAREFITLNGVIGTINAQGDQDLSLAEVLALITQLRWTLTESELIELIYPDSIGTPGRSRTPQHKHLRSLLRTGSTWLVGLRGDQRALQFGHQMLGEVALAAWRLECFDRPLTEEAIALEARAIAEASESSNSYNADEQSKDEKQRQKADAWLHAILAGDKPGRGCQHRWKDQKNPPPTKPWIGPKENKRDTVMDYALVWGPLHALKAAAQLSNQVPWYETLGQRARELLINAPYLQSAFRAHTRHSGIEQSQAGADALRQTFIAADKLAEADPSRSLRRDVEIALLHWHQNIALGRTQVGAVLWNLVGDTAQGKAIAQDWKKSLDAPALITKLPGIPMDLTRRLGGFSEVALTQCGRWMVTSGDAGTAVWDLQDGTHRPLRIALLEQEFEHLQCAAVGEQICLAGSKGNDIVLALVDLRTGGAKLARYGRLELRISSIALHISGEHVLVASRSGDPDSNIVLMSLSISEIADDSLAQKKTGAHAKTGKIARYSGKDNSIDYIALHASEGHVLVACACFDGTVSLLRLSQPEIAAEAEAQNKPGAHVKTGKFARYRGHKGQIRSIALHVTANQAVVAIGPHDPDGSVVLLSLDISEIAANAESQIQPGAQAETGKIARYKGHNERVTSIALHASDTQVLVVSGSRDNTVGLLRLSLIEIADDAQVQNKPGAQAKIGKITSYRGHDDEINSIALHASDTEVLVVSGSRDNTVGLLKFSLIEIGEHTAAQREIVAQAKSDQLARYAGHEDKIEFIALHAVDNQVLVASSGHRDCTVGLLRLGLTEISADTLAQSVPNALAQTGKIARYYTGLNHWVTSVALHASDDQVVVASGTIDGFVDLLSLSLFEIEADAEAQRKHGAKAKIGKIARYTGHDEYVECIALHTVNSQVVAVSGSWDKTVGILSLSLTEIATHANARGTRGGPTKSGKVTRYTGHDDMITSIALHASADQVLVVSGTQDETIGLRCLTLSEIVPLAKTRGKRVAKSESGKFARYYIGHYGTTSSIALHASANQVLVVSGFRDGTIGQLSLMHSDMEEDFREQHDPNVPAKSDRLIRAESNLIGSIKWRASRNPLMEPADSVQWLGLSSEAALMSFSRVGDVASAPDISMVCPFYVPGFEAMDLELFDDRTFVVGGACGSDVALMLLELVTPA